MHKIFLFGFLALQTSMAVAQPTTNIITRVLMVESQYDRGTIFSLDVEGREYWITAKHILTGAKHPPYGSFKSKTAKLRILDPAGPNEHWLTEDFSVLDPGVDIDIVVLATAVPILTNPLPSVSADSAVMLGGACEFLGFPHGSGWSAHFNDATQSWWPYVKHCTVSDLPSPEQRFWVLDGINNQGFSGGPVIYGTGPALKVFAVVSGFITESADVMSPPPPANAPPKSPHSADQSEETVSLNSGFIIAFDISGALDVIHKNPIGPLRRAN